MKKMLIWFLLSIFLSNASAQVRLKELSRLVGISSKQIVGYGLVVGLNGTGDSRRSAFTTQSVANMLQRFGITVPRNRLRSRNVAAVMVTAEVPGYVRQGDRITVTLSSIGDAKSLEGGVLLRTPLVDEKGQLIAMAQGPVSVGGFSVQTTGGGGVRQNHTLVGRIPDGAIVQVDMAGNIPRSDTLLLSVKQKDVTTTQRIAQVINDQFGDSTAIIQDPFTIAIHIPPSYRQSDKRYEFLARLEQLEVQPDVPARVVINERTGTVVVGGNVRILPAAVAHGNLSVEIRSQPIVSQPAPFSQGQTVVVPHTEATVYQDEGKVITLDNATTVQEVAQALNSLGVMPRDIIAILQALKEAGALQADLIIM